MPLPEKAVNTLSTVQLKRYLSRAPLANIGAGALAVQNRWLQMAILTTAHSLDNVHVAYCRHRVPRVGGL